MPEEEKDNVILGSAYTNFASCLTSLHQYKDALLARKKAESYPLQPGAYATPVMLYAAMRDNEQFSVYMEKLKDQAPDLALQISRIAEEILNGTFPGIPPRSP